MVKPVGGKTRANYAGKYIERPRNGVRRKDRPAYVTADRWRTGRFCGRYGEVLRPEYPLSSYDGSAADARLVRFRTNGHWRRIRPTRTTGDRVVRRPSDTAGQSGNRRMIQAP